MTEQKHQSELFSFEYNISKRATTVKLSEKAFGIFKNILGNNRVTQYIHFIFFLRFI